MRAAGQLQSIDAVVFRQPVRVGGRGVVLRRFADVPAARASIVATSSGGAEPREVALDLVAGFVRADRPAMRSPASGRRRAP